MARRKPTIPERAQLARAAVDYIAHHAEREPDQEPYDLAFRGLGKVSWLHAQSRDGIAAYAAKCWVTGEEPYAGMSPADLEDAEHGRQAQAQHNRAVAAETNQRIQTRIDVIDQTSVRCTAPTKSGRPCSIEPLAGRNKCHVHAPDLQCGAVKANGQRCAIPTGGRGPCAAHRSSVSS
ncbi:hypothetical protein IU510_29635 [Nocardia cyriacigeorgica]|uniref:hypothetical protein n=1 Tax=Nocardia cyriacigeorgica TaxID=135487 RepID=UPI0018933CD6|nr:hypothetical protein [Nocardia cyriacigeorgica]MBF6102182.1 hypothetical protein [Nocardia cyriacigeorgica]